MNTNAVDPFALPFVALNSRIELPTYSGIYFAIDDNQAIQYIGIAINLRNRWKSHQRLKSLLALGTIKIAYLHIDSASALAEAERSAIARFKPIMNGKAIRKNLVPVKPQLTTFTEKDFSWMMVETPPGVVDPKHLNRIQHPDLDVTKGLILMSRGTPGWYLLSVFLYWEEKLPWMAIYDEKEQGAIVVFSMSQEYAVADFMPLKLPCLVCGNNLRGDAIYPCRSGTSKLCS